MPDRPVRLGGAPYAPTDGAWLPVGIDWSEPVLVDALERAHLQPRCADCGRAVLIRVARTDRQHPVQMSGGRTVYPVLLLCPLRAEGVVPELPVGDGRSNYWPRCNWGVRIGEIPVQERAG